ncbi:MAG: GTPase Era [bacterium]|nr:GTPase Era [bacterium]MDA1024420.1 GTPase Era [bacterium]
MPKSGFATIIGRSNVGKSTLINSIVGQKIAITTWKPQTTRRPIQGILTNDHGQIVFVDTPGIMQKARDPLTQALLRFVKMALKDIEVILYVVDPTRPIGNEEKQVMQLIQDIQVPKLLVINKIDDIAARQYIDMYRDLEEKFDGMIEVSAIKGSNVNRIVDWVMEKIPEGEMMYPHHQKSSQPVEELVAEIIREKLFLRLRKEVPYSVHVEVEEIDRRKNGTMYVKAKIMTLSERYKNMIIGKGGVGVKEVGLSSRKELEAMTNEKIFLDLHVETDTRWVERLDQ